MQREDEPAARAYNSQGEEIPLADVFGVDVQPRLKSLGFGITTATAATSEGERIEHAFLMSGCIGTPVEDIEKALSASRKKASEYAEMCREEIAEITERLRAGDSTPARWAADVWTSFCSHAMLLAVLESSLLNESEEWASERAQTLVKSQRLALERLTKRLESGEVAVDSLPFKSEMGRLVASLKNQLP